jgi:hypothetical protein
VSAGVATCDEQIVPTRRHNLKINFAIVLLERIEMRDDMRAKTVLKVSKDWAAEFGSCFSGSTVLG